MGMSASQARLLSLQARQSNLEYQGQQINQERTILSQQCTELYNSLLNMTVPTPPSTSDFTTVQYSGSLNTSNFSLGTIIPNGNNYTVNLEYQKTGHAVESKGKAEVKHTAKTITVAPVDTTPSTYTYATANKMGVNDKPNDGIKFFHAILTEEELAKCTDVYVKEGEKFIPKKASEVNLLKDDVYVMDTIKNETTDAEGTTIPANYDTDTDYIVDKTGLEETVKPGVASESECYNFMVKVGNSYRNASPSDFVYNDTTKQWEFRTDREFFQESSNGTEIDNPNYTAGSEYSVGGNAVYSLTSSEAKARITDEDMESYISALRNKFPEYADNIEDSFSVYFTQNGSTITPHFVLSTDLTGVGTNQTDSTWAQYYDYVPNGTYTETVKEEDCQLTFDTSGRILSISIPTRGKDGSITYTEVPLTASKVTDEQAYSDAYAEWEYAQYEYDKKQQEINAKTEIIQQQDRNLELKLQRLDNERTQITTEIEAVEKVINDNIEKSYKTFSG